MLVYIICIQYVCMCVCVWFRHIDWLVVGPTPLKIWVRQLGWLFHSQLNGNIQVMFQSTNQKMKSQSINWFKGRITGKSHISWENLWFPVDFPLSQTIESMIAIHELQYDNCESRLWMIHCGSFLLMDKDCHRLWIESGV